MAPHAPFVLGQSADYLKGCFPRCSLWATTEDETGLSRKEFSQRLGTQVAALNGALTSAFGEIVAADPEAFIILMSDHGIRHDLNDVDEHFRILFAARTPGHEDLYPDDVAPVNVLRRFLSRVQGDDYPDLDYRAWVSDWFKPLVLQPRQ
jgi:hypothetical protein